MGFLDLFILQIIAHLLADYTFQTKAMAFSKDKFGFKSSSLKWHISIVLGFTILLGLDWTFIPFAIVLALTHWIIDGCKPLLLRSALNKYAFFIDQLLHLLILFLTVYCYTNYINWDPIIANLNPASLYIIAVFILCTKPANIIIREIFDVYDIFFEGNEEDLPNAGRLIGIVERWLVLIFILSGQFSAVGFLIGAKSILRFKDANLLKTEYVLVGTLLSFGIAVACAVVYKLIFFI